MLLAWLNCKKILQLHFSETSQCLLDYVEASPLRRTSLPETLEKLIYIGICAGKNSVADYLTETHGFVRLHLAQKPSPLLEVKKHNAKENSFTSVESLLDFVTKQWQQRWVTTDVWNENILENLLRRPSFILVSVDAPVSLRWKRLKNRLVWDQ